MPIVEQFFSGGKVRKRYSPCHHLMVFSYLFENCCNLFPIGCKTFYRRAKQNTSSILLVLPRRAPPEHHKTRPYALLLLPKTHRQLSSPRKHPPDSPPAR